MKIIKPLFWNNKKPNLLSYLLFPLTIFIRLNNFLIDYSKKSKNKNIKTLCVGNIYVGGTGKTPTTISIFRLLKKLNKKLSVGKKFYPSHVDEHAILKRETNLILGNSRKEIITKAINTKNKILIFDDGLQDKLIDYDLKFVCFNSSEWIGNGKLIPSGPLRESLKSLKKFDAVLLKTNGEKNQHIIKSIKSINSQIKIFLTEYKIENSKIFNKNQNYVIFSGIGSPQNFKDLLIKNKFRIKKELIYPDHHNYKKNEIRYIENLAKKMNAKIITTEKDFVKVKKFSSKNINFLKVKLEIKDKINLLKFIKLKLYG